MKLRITGTPQECAAAVAVLRAALVVREVSQFYPNRGTSLLGRVYLDAPLDPDPHPDPNLQSPTPASTSASTSTSEGVR